MPVLGRKIVRELRDLLDDVREQASNVGVVTPTFYADYARRAEPLFHALDAALETKRAVKAARRRREAKRERHAAETSDIRRAVWTRSGGRCEHCGATLRDDEGDLDHGPGFSGNGRRSQEQSLYTTWRLCRRCHHRRTDGEPSRQFWLESFRDHLLRQVAANLSTHEIRSGYENAIVAVETHI